MAAYVVAITIITGFISSYNVQAEELKVTNDMVLTSSDIFVNGWQIKERYDEAGEADVSFRTVAEAPEIGATITVEDKEYIVAKMGTIYVLDTDYSGVTANRKLSKDYTILDEESLTDDGSIQYYKGANDYQGENRTYGFITSEKGFIQGAEEGRVRCATTITQMSKLMAYSIQMRAFVVTEDGTIIYSEKAWTTSVANIAYQLYINSMMTTEEGHNFLYTSILNSDILAKVREENSSYPYYLTSQIEYGWSPIVKPY